MRSLSMYFVDKDKIGLKKIIQGYSWKRKMKIMAHHQFGGSINYFTPWLSNHGIVTYHTTIFRKPWKQTWFPW